jgi:hypothetical protein
MEFVGEPFRVLMPYDEESERALVAVHQHGVPAALARTAVVA